MNEDEDMYPLDDVAIALLKDIAKAEQDLQQAAQRQLDVLGAQRHGVLLLFLRQNSLTGDWKLAENGRELVHQPPVAAGG